MVKIWENKNAQRAVRGAALSTMALSLAACGGSSSSDSAGDSAAPVEPTTPVVTPVSAALTIGIDSVSGTSANDTFSAARTADSIDTWNSGDTISGGDGADSLTAVISNDVTPASGAVTGVETITITSIGANAVTFSTAAANLISGVTEVINLASTGNLTLTRLVDLADITINNTASATIVTYADSLLAGSADAVTLSVNGATGAINIGNATAGAGTGIETLNIVTSGALSQFSAVNLDASATTVTVTGSGDLDINGADAFASVGTFNASAATGDIDVSFLADGVTGATNTKTISTGSGNDDIDISNIDPATVGAVSVNAGAGNDLVTVGTRGATDYTIVGGDGTDTLEVGVTGTAALFGGVSGFERLTNTSGTAVQNFALYTGNSTFSIARADDDTDFTNAVGITTLELNGTATTDNVLLSLAADGTADSLTVVGIAAANAYLELNIADFETVTVNSADGTVDTVGTDDGTNDTIATDLTSLTAVGDNNIDLGDVSSTALTTVDLTGMSGAGSFTAYFDSNVQNITVTANTTTATTFTGTITVKTGAGADTIVGTENADTITGGSGNDTITGGDGDDTLDGGTGSDTYIFDATGAGNGLDTVVVAFGAGGDVFDMSAFAVSMTAAGAGDVAFAEIAAAATTDYDITGHLVLLDTTVEASVDTAAEIAALIDGVGDAFGITAGGKAIIVAGDASGANDVARIYFVHDANGDGDVADSNEVVNVLVSSAAVDLDTLVAANVDLVA